jgi:phospholipase/carboxylesterase
MMHTRSTCRIPRPPEGFYVSQVESPRRLPVLTFLPTGFEPNYPYPLLVFLHGRGTSEEQTIRLAPRVSRRNYICIGLRGPQEERPRSRPEGYSLSSALDADAFAEEYVFRAIEQACANYFINTDRIFLAGLGEGATLAYRLGLGYAGTFAGVIAINGELPQGGPFLRLPEARQVRVLIQHGIANSLVPLSAAKRGHRLLYSAGLPVELLTYPTTHRTHPHMLRDINRWVMDSMNPVR